VPEGDTIHRLAARLGPALVGRPIARLWVRDRGEVAALCGATVVAVEAVGKHLLVGIGDDHVLHTHLGMPGRVRRTGGPVFPTWDTSAIVATAEGAVVWRSARTAVLVRRDDPGFVRALQRVGPDLLAPEVDLEDVVRRAHASSEGARPLVDVLLDQSIAAGIGNVFKSEVLFACGLAPTRALASVDRSRLRDAYALARVMLQRGVRDGHRDTVHVVDPRRPRGQGDQLWVYDRARLPCRRCGAAIVRVALGVDRRGTYLCPVCQRDAA
jgi:endonuclease-8